MNNGHCFRSFSFSHDMCGGVVSSQHYYSYDLENVFVSCTQVVYVQIVFQTVVKGKYLTQTHTLKHCISQALFSLQ